LVLITTSFSCAGWKKEACWKKSPNQQSPPTKEKSPMATTPGWKHVPTPSFYTDDANPWQTAEGLTAACQRTKEGATVLRRQLAALKEAGEASTLENTLWPLNALDIELDTGRSWASFINAVHPSQEIRDAAETCKKDLSALANEISLDPNIYAALAGVDASSLDAQAKRYVAKSLVAFKRSGVDKDEATRTELKTLHKKMVDVGQQFGKNVRQDVKSITVDSAADLKGMPEDWIKAHKPNADGKIVITTNYPDFYPLQRYAENSNLRKELYNAFSSRAWPKNEALLRELLTLRHRYANLLNHRTWASYTAEDKMVKNAATVDAFIKNLRDMVRPQADAEIKEVLERKQKDDPEAKTVEVFDRFYYVNKLQKEKHDFDAKLVRPYFAYDAVKQGILDLYAELFDVKFIRLDKEPVWHASVEAYALESDGKRLGKVYLDMHPRDGKYKHAAVFPTQVGLENGIEPICSLVCNFPEPTADSKGLMEHSQVQTFFHEFGHAIHHLLGSGARWGSISGFNVEWDFVETPSQILEEWAWDPKVLARFAKHHETGEPIPADMVQKMRTSSEFGKGLHLMRQIFYTAYSFYIHDDKNPSLLNLENYTDKITKGYGPYPRLENDRVYANFGHLIGYSSMYYTYQWSLVIAKDLFTRFKEEGLLNSKVARDYREAILKPGGTINANEMVKNFLGRSYNLDAYKAWLRGD
jgi:thimet oligopeptidase